MSLERVAWRESVDLKSVLRLDLEDAGIAKLKAEDFQGLIQLYTLELDKNLIEELPEGVFSDLSELNFLNLETNKLRVLPHGIFSNTPKLSRLNLSDNRLVGVPDLSGLPKLLDLNMWSNRVSEIGERTFADNALIEDLDLSGNQISKIDPLAFSHTILLEYLRLNGNEIKSIGQEFKNSSNLILLLLSDNRIQNLAEDSFRSLTKLKKLGLSHNYIRKLPVGIFGGLESIFTISLDHNLIETIPAQSFTGNGSMKQLHLHSNNIETLAPDTFAGLASIELLNLYENRFRTIPGNIFVPIPGLKVLNLSHNYLSAIDAEDFEGLSDLKVLGLTGNLITDLGDDFLVQMPSLEKLELDGNRIESISPKAFKRREDYPNLYSICMSGNLIDDWSDSYAYLTKTLGIYPAYRSGSCPDKIETQFLYPINTSAKIANNSTVDTCSKSAYIRYYLNARPRWPWFETCAGVTDKFLGYKKTLFLSGSESDHLQINDLVGHANLHYLAFDGEFENAGLPVGFFNGLGSVERLYLGVRGQIGFDEAWVEGMRNLRYFDVSATRLKRWPDFKSTSLSKVKELKLGWMGSERYDQNSLKGLDQLETLHLPIDREHMVNKEFLESVSQLKSLNLRTSNILIQGFPENALQATHNLEKFSLVAIRSADIKLSKGFFRNLDNLKVVSLEGIRIVDFDPEIFSEENFSLNAEVHLSRKYFSPEEVSALQSILGERLSFWSTPE